MPDPGGPSGNSKRKPQDDLRRSKKKMTTLNVLVGVRRLDETLARDVIVLFDSGAGSSVDERVTSNVMTRKQAKLLGLTPVKNDVIVKVTGVTRGAKVTTNEICKNVILEIGLNKSMSVDFLIVNEKNVNLEQPILCWDTVQRLQLFNPGESSPERQLDIEGTTFLYQSRGDCYVPQLHSDGAFSEKENEADAGIEGLKETYIENTLYVKADCQMDSGTKKSLGFKVSALVREVRWSSSTQ
jgi:hypothetical protein